MRKYLLVLSLLALLMLVTGTSVLAQGTVPPPPPPPPPAPVGAAGGTFTNGPASVTFPANSVPNGSMLTISQVNQSQLPGTGGFRLGSVVYQFSMTGPDGKPITTFSPPIQVCFTLSAAEIAALGGVTNQGNLAIQWFNSATGKWETQTTTQTTGTNQFCTTVSHFSIYGLFVQPDAPAAAKTEDLNLAGMAPWALALGAVLVLGLVLALRKK
jgi:hypothetical protein